MFLNLTGIVFLDDFFAPDWPGVTEGLEKYLNRNPKLVPFCIGHNKLLLCNFLFRNFCRDYFVENHPLYNKTVNYHLGLELLRSCITQPRRYSLIFNIFELKPHIFFNLLKAREKKLPLIRVIRAGLILSPSTICLSLFG